MSELTLSAPTWLDRDLYPFARHFMETPEGRIHYIDEGHGEAVLFLHGTPTWSFVYRRLISELSDDMRCIAIDHLGFGLSDKPPDGSYHPADHARRLKRFVEKMELDRFVLVLHDFGGPIGLDWATRFPSKLKGLVLLNTWMWSQSDDPTTVWTSRLVRSPLGRFLYRWMNFSPRVLLKMGFADRSALTASIHRHYLAPFSSRSQRLGPWVLGCELASDWYDEVWRRRDAIADLPTQLIWGLKDPIFGTEHLQRLESVFRQVATLRLEDVGHFPQEEAPNRCIGAIRSLAARACDSTSHRLSRSRPDV